MALHRRPYLFSGFHVFPRGVSWIPFLCSDVFPRRVSCMNMNCIVSLVNGLEQHRRRYREKPALRADVPNTCEIIHSFCFINMAWRCIEDHICLWLHFPYCLPCGSPQNCMGRVCVTPFLGCPIYSDAARHTFGFVMFSLHSKHWGSHCPEMVNKPSQPVPHPAQCCAAGTLVLKMLLPCGSPQFSWGGLFIIRVSWSLASILSFLTLRFHRLTQRCKINWHES